MSLPPRRLLPEDWVPVGVPDLEPNALAVVKSTDHRCVLAGPGAGKTELLAQRAAYLLQTGASPAPQRILAISFKRDAARNLAERVSKRCHRDHASRLDSLTFDAFAKGLVDRFGQALSDRWRPSVDYEIDFPKTQTYRDFLAGVGRPPSAVGTVADVQGIAANTFERRYLFDAPLPEQVPDHLAPGPWAAYKYWAYSLRGKRSRLSFPMIGRLAELMLRLSEPIRVALSLTYSHVFMDEFQDTTPVQYDLVRRIFLDTEAIITAVGDNKQQIMRWAMAMDDPFRTFEKNFGARRTPLLNNYRSSPELVRIQHVLARSLDSHCPKPRSQTSGTVSDDCCAIWDFSNPAIEASQLATFVAAQMKAYGLGARDFAVLVRQKPDDYVPTLSRAFAKVGLSLRNEAGMIESMALQELMAEEFSDLLLLLLKVGTAEAAGRFWNQALHAISALWSEDIDESSVRGRTSQALDEFSQQFLADHPNPPGSEEQALAVVTTVLSFLGEDRLIAAYPAYGQGGWLAKVSLSAQRHLQLRSTGAANWQAAIDAYEGAGAVPLMTLHKSKGLEYHTVIFVGLDDSAWWSFGNDAAEGTAGFFVAFTRAKQRVVFTYCRSRGRRVGIEPLYKLLRNAGVDSIDHG